jgi:hypothetical protein
MLNETPSSLSKIITSLKVAALVMVLGTVVIAAEQRIAAVPAAKTVAAVTSQPASGSATQPVTSDYFPAQFPAPTGEISEPAPTF